MLIDDGWHFECWGCYRQVSCDEIYDYDEEKELDGPVYRNNAVWCSTECRDEYDERNASEAREKDGAVRQATMKWPNGQMFKAHRCGSGGIIVEFAFGGSDKARWLVGDDHVSVAASDQDVWLTFREIAARMRAEKEATNDNQ